MNKVYDKTEFLKYMNKRAKELYSSSELNYWDCYYALQTMNRCIAEILENGDSVNIYKWWDIKPKLFKSVKRYSPLLDMQYLIHGQKTAIRSLSVRERMRRHRQLITLALRRRKRMICITRLLIYCVMSRSELLKMVYITGLT